MKTMLYQLIAINFIFLNMTSCKTQDKLKYIYADGNNNTYIIKKTELEYKPVTPLESSSGIYSGGKPKTIKLNQVDYDKILALLNKAIEDKSMHIDQRVMMSGMLIIEDNGSKQSYILGAQSQSKAEIESLLKEIMDKNP